MRVYNQYIVSLAVAFSIVNVSMAATGQASLDLHFMVLVIVSLVITLLSVLFSPRSRRALSVVGSAFFAGFLVVLTLRMIDILGGA